MSQYNFLNAGKMGYFKASVASLGVSIGLQLLLGFLSKQEFGAKKGVEGSISSAHRVQASS